MRIRIVSLLLVLPLAFAAAADPVLTAITPPTGFTSGGTRVRIEGSQITAASGQFFCHPWYQHFCVVEVFFGEHRGLVLEANQNEVVALTPPGAEGARVDVTIVRRSGERTSLPGAFTYTDKPATPVRSQYRAYLVPIRPGELRGANGSHWKTELTAHNGTDSDVPPRVVPVMTGPNAFVDVAAGTSRRLDLDPGAVPAIFEGLFLYVPEPLADAMTLKLRVRELSRDAEGWGVEVPVVPLSTGFQSRVRLLDVPVDPRYRTLLRIYGEHNTYLDVWNFDFPTGARVYAYSMATGALIEKRQVVLHEPAPFIRHHPAAFPFVASSLAIDPITSAVRASGEDRVRIEVEWVGDHNSRITPPIFGSVWAFVSVTNNNTQQVTLITPSVP